MPRTFTALIAVAVLAATGLTFSGGAEAANPTPIPWHQDVAPFCGSPLALSGFVDACSDRDSTAGFTRDGLDCPAGISEARLLGVPFVLADLTYAELQAPNASDRQEAIDLENAIEQAFGAWSNWCVPSRIIPTPTPTATPVVVVVERPAPSFTG